MAWNFGLALTNTKITKALHRSDRQPENNYNESTINDIYNCVELCLTM